MGRPVSGVLDPWHGVDLRQALHGLPTESGAPQGGPLSPLLSNIVLHQLDMELEARGRRFARYADDFQVFKTTWRAAYRVMDRLVRFLEKRMHLTVHREKSGVVPWEEATFLCFGYAHPAVSTGRR